MIGAVIVIASPSDDSSELINGEITDDGADLEESPTGYWYHFPNDYFLEPVAYYPNYQPPVYEDTKYEGYKDYYFSRFYSPKAHYYF